MNYLVIGAGMMGRALAHDLARSVSVQRVTLADVDDERARTVVQEIGSDKVQPLRLNVEYYDSVIDAMENHVCVIAATTYRHNVALTKAAIEAGVHLCDLGGNDDVVRRQLELHRRAEERQILVVPNCGLAPGMANVLAARGIELFDEVDTVKIRVGGLPQHPRPPLNYQLLFSPEGLVNEYTGKSVVLRNFVVTEVETMTDVEEIEFPPPFGKLEAFNTSGGSSLLPTMFAGKVRELDYKTIRYPGHCERFKTLLDLGFASSEPITVGASVLTAKEMFFELLRRKLSGSDPDVVLMRVSIRGKKEGRETALTFNTVDFFDEKSNITAMMRMTAYPTSVIAQMVVGGDIAARGVRTPEQCVPLEPFLGAIRSRGISITLEWSPRAS